VRLWQAILAGLQAFSASSLLADLMPKAYAGLLVLATAALQAGTIAYMNPKQAQQPEIDVEAGKHARR